MRARIDKVLMLLTSDFVRARHDALRAKAPQLEVVTELGLDPRDDIEVAFTYHLPAGTAPRLPALKLVASVGAGADAILGAADLPAHVKVTRAVEAGLGYSMAQYVVLQLLHTFRHQATLQRQQAEARWARVPVPDARGTTVGIMGLGSIGKTVANAVAALGFEVIGWTRSNPGDASVRTFTGADQLPAFLRATRHLVCLLPLTPETTGLLGRATLSQLPRGACVINAARGGIVVENELVALIDEGHLGGAALDVFAKEPLPLDSPLWAHDRVVVTPHIAAQPSVDAVVEQFLENLRRLEAGEPLLHEVDRRRGY